MIKSHHNVGGLPDDMTLELVEPLRDLFKDEVRALGTELGLPDEMVWRQPFPGPGLGVRIIGEVTPDKVAMLQDADAIVRAEIAAAGLEREIWQAFAVLADISSVGVMGDERTYGHPIIMRAVTSDDAMTADWARLPYDAAGTDVAAGSSTRSPASIGSPTTSRRSRRARSSGSSRSHVPSPDRHRFVMCGYTRRSTWADSVVTTVAPPSAAGPRYRRGRLRSPPACSSPNRRRRPDRRPAARVQELTDDLERLEETSDILAEDYVVAIDEQRRLEREVAAAEQLVAEREAQVGQLRGHLAQVAVQSFMGAGTDGLGPMFNDSASYTDELQRDQLARVALSAGDASTDELDQAVTDLQAQREILDDKRAEAAEAAEAVQSAKEATEQQTSEYRQARSDAEGELGRLVQEEEERRARQSYERQRAAEEAARGPPSNRRRRRRHSRHRETAAATMGAVAAAVAAAVAVAAAAAAPAVSRPAATSRRIFSGRDGDQRAR